MVGSLINAFTSHYRKGKAQKDEYAAHDRLLALDAERPQYNAESLSSQSVNPLYDQNINLAKSYEPLSKVNLLPGQSYMQNRVDNNSANAIAKAGMEGITSPSQYAQLLASTTESQNNATTDMAIQGTQNRMINQDKFVSAMTGANTAKAEEQDKAWNQNIWEPYNEKKQREYMQWIEAKDLKQKHALNAQAAGSQSAQDVGNFFKSFFSPMSNMGKGNGDGQQSVK
jgi:hypothetical protein